MDTPTPEQPLTYEETPIIEPVAEPAPPAPSPQQQPAQPSKPSGSLAGTLGMIGLFIALFAVGVGISVFLRQWLASRVENPSQTALGRSTPTVAPTPYGNILTSPIASPTAVIADPYAGWKAHQVISGVTKQPVPGISFKLPPEMLSPICDGASCASQGTYLPNGSRFTVAPRGKGQLLIDARGNVVVTDSSGKSFTTKQVTLGGGRKALEYAGLFSGTTVGGYTFSQMRGLMIEIDEDETLEMNHFTPSGVSAEFVKDDVLFDKIVASLTVNRFPDSTASATVR